MTKKPTFTIPSEESDAGRIAVYLDPDDIRWLLAHCACDDAATDDDRDRCARIRFRSSTALHKTTQAIVAPSDCHFVASICLLTEQNGGRNSAIHTGCRPQVFIDGEDCDAFLRHIANAETLPRIYRLLRDSGYEPPLVVTPEEFSGNV